MIVPALLSHVSLVGKSTVRNKRGKQNKSLSRLNLIVENGVGRQKKKISLVFHAKRIPDNLSMEEGAAVQPLAIAIHACRRAGIQLGTELVILGAGPIGVLCAMTARAMGANKILITGK